MNLIASSDIIDISVVGSVDANALSRIDELWIMGTVDYSAIAYTQVNVDKFVQLKNHQKLKLYPFVIIETVHSTKLSANIF